MPSIRRENVRHATLFFCAEGVNVRTVGAGEKGQEIMKVKCPACETEYEIEESYFGRSAECEVCGRKFIVGSKAKLKDGSSSRQCETVTNTFNGQNMSIKEPVGEKWEQKIEDRPRTTYVIRISHADNQRYFSQQNTPSALINYIFAVCLFSVIGLGLVCIVATVVSKLLGVFVFMALIVGVYFIFKLKPRILTDKEIDIQARALSYGIDKMAFEKLGIDPEEVSMVEPLRFWGYNFNRVLRDTANITAWWIQGKDSKWRTSEVTHTVFYFGEHSIYCYKLTLSLVSKASKHETEEYFYRDVVSVKTDSTTVQKEGGGNFINVNMFILTNTGGERLACETDDPQRAEAAVKAVRTLLKQKKF